MTNEQSFASASLTRHLIRGVVGFGTLIGSVTLLPLVGPVSLLLAPIGLFAFRGCPTCWAVGLVQTVSMGRLERTCVDGRCELRRADLDGDPLGAQVVADKADSRSRAV